MKPGFRLSLALVVVLAAVLRLLHLTADLPDFLEEAIPFRTALGLWSWTGGRTDWNPHFFHYPSLTIYLHFVLQKLGWLVAHARGVARTPADWYLLLLVDPASLVVPARLLHVAFDLLAVALTGLVAERLRRGAGLPAALLAALSPTMLTTSRSIFTDTVAGALALAALERMLAWREGGGAWRLAAAVVLLGLAAGAKYPAALALLPLAWLMASREVPPARGLFRSGLARWLLAAAGAVAVFLLTTPYALLDFAAFRSDVGFEGLHVASGHLGHLGGSGIGFTLRGLLRDLGPVGLALFGGSVLLIVQRARRVVVVALWLYLLAFFVPLAGARIGAERYLVAVLPAAAALAAAAAVELSQRAAPRWRPAAVAVLLASLLALPLVAGVRAAAAGAAFTQVEARRWMQAHLAPEDLILQEAWGPGLPALGTRIEVATSPAFRAASPEMQRRYLGRGCFHAVELPLTVAGRVASRLTAANGVRTEVEVFPSALDFNCIAYDPRLFVNADLLVTSGAVRDRFEAEPARFADQCHLYRLLDSTAAVAARFEPHRGHVGPTITVYRIGPRARSAFAAAGPLPPLWWAEKIPDSYRRAATTLLGSPWEGGAPLRPDGTAALWVRSLARVYQDALQPFAISLAVNLVDLGRCDAAQPLLEGTLLVSRDPAAAALYDFCAARVAARSRSTP